MMLWVRVGVLGAVVAAGWAGQDPGFALNDRGLAASRGGDYVEAERLLREAGDYWQHKGQGYEAHLGTAELNLGQVLCSQGRRSEGAKLFEHALALFRRSIGMRNERTLAALNFLGVAYLMGGTPERAEALYLEAIPIEREVMPEGLQLARSLDGLSAVRLHQDRFDEALSLAEEGLAVTLQAQDKEEVDVALAYANVAEVHRIARRDDRALPLYRKARAIYERQLGAEHPRVAAVLSQEGLILMNDGKLSLADQAMTRSLEIIRKSCPGCVFEQWVGESNLGLLRMKQGKYGEADHLFTDALQAQEKSGARPGPETAAVLQKLAQIRQKQRRYEDAARLNQKADNILSFQ
jgi:tetratricopeptide (TPR) repeat protein